MRGRGVNARFVKSGNLHLRVVLEMSEVRGDRGTKGEVADVILRPHVDRALATSSSRSA